MPSDLIGTKEAAELIGCTVSTLTRRAQLGRVNPAMKLPGETGAYLWRRSDIEAMADTNDAA